MLCNSNKYPILLRIDPVDSGATAIDVPLIEAGHIVVEFRTLSGNKPEAFGNVISVWAGTEIGWNNKPNPIVTVPVMQDDPVGDRIISLGDNPPSGPPYTVAYGTSKNGTTYCAAQVAGDKQPSEPITTRIFLRWLGTDSLLAEFRTAPLNNPKANGNWIGLWEGKSFTYDGTNRIKKVPVDAETAKGFQSMNELSLKFKTFYTLGYACGPRDEDLAAWITFETQPFLSYLRHLIFPKKNHATGSKG